MLLLIILVKKNPSAAGHPDGKVLVEAEERPPSFERCTRWDEVSHMALEHARWNAKLGTPADFVLLNRRGAGTALEDGFDCVRIDAARGDVEAQLASLEAMLKSTQPHGATPLTEAVRKIRFRISPETQEVARRGRRVALVIATDGLPTGEFGGGQADMRAFGQELRRICGQLPVHLVVRLCTDEKDVVGFYNALDEESEVDLEVIDDIQGEASEIRNAGNRWLVYSPLLHRLREGGAFLKVLDLLDERRLEPMEVCLLCQLLLQQSPDDRPLPTEPEAFCDEARRRLPLLPRVLCPLRLRWVPPIEVDELEFAVLPKLKLHRACAECGVQYCRLQ